MHIRKGVIDLHADSLMWGRWVGYDLLKKHEPPFIKSAFCGHVDLPRLREGGVIAQWFGLVSLPIGESGMDLSVHEQIDVLEQTVARDPSALRIVRSADELQAAEREGAMAALLGIEGAHALQGDLDALDRFARRHVRSLGLLHFSANKAGYPAYGYGKSDARGLTLWGKQLVEKCEERGVIVDLAHINRAGFLDACAMAKKPQMVSHTGVQGGFEHWRNIDDEQLRAIAKTGGCIGVLYVPAYLGGDGLDAVVRHLQHIVKVAGEDTPALGSDWDGMIVPTPALCDPRGVPSLLDALAESGVPERVVDKIACGNVLRLLTDAPPRSNTD